MNKKAIYIIAWGILGFLTSFIIHAIVEMIYLRSIPEQTEIAWSLGGACALPLWLIYLLPILGIFLGVWAGFFFWSKVSKK